MNSAKKKAQRSKQRAHVTLPVPAKAEPGSFTTVQLDFKDAPTELPNTLLGQIPAEVLQKIGRFGDSMLYLKPTCKRAYMFFKGVTKLIDRQPILSAITRLLRTSEATDFVASVGLYWELRCLFSKKISRLNFSSNWIKPKQVFFTLTENLNSHVTFQRIPWSRKLDFFPELLRKVLKGK